MHDGHDTGAGHTHDHEHEHDHEHMHDEAADASDPKAYAKKLLAVLSYMREHNVSHAEELGDLAEELELLGFNDAAELLDDAADEMSMSVGSLDDAISELTLAIDEQE